MPLMAVNDVLYHMPDRRPLQDVLTAIRLNVPVAKAGYELAANAERHMKPPTEMARLFRHHPDALSETLRFAEKLWFSLNELKHNYPEETTRKVSTPHGAGTADREGATKRYPSGIPEKVEGLIRHELSIVAYKNTSAIS